MIWNKIDEIKNVLSLTVLDNLLFFYQKEFDKTTFRVFDILANKFLLEREFIRDFDYQLCGKEIYFSCDNLVIKINLLNSNAKIVLKTEDDYVSVVNESFFITSKYNSETKSYTNVLINLENEVIDEFSGYDTFRESNNEYILCTNFTGDLLALFDIKKSQYLWDVRLPFELSNKSFILDKIVIVFSRNELIALNKMNGSELYRTKDAFTHYCLDKANNKLYGLRDKQFEAINILTGEKEIISELIINSSISPHLTYYDNGFLYFTSLANNRLPNIGAVDVESGILKFTQTLKLDGIKSFRNSLDKPIVVNNQLYVKDAENTLHIFEKK